VYVPDSRCPGEKTDMPGFQNQQLDLITYQLVLFLELIHWYLIFTVPPRVGSHRDSWAYEQCYITLFLLHVDEKVSTPPTHVHCYVL
jgi:hypothetical protein